MVRTLRLPSISYVVARSYPGNVIGCENQLPWRLRSDLRRFKEITSGHAIIMGRKTFDSIGKPLPNRNNIVISRRESRINNHSPWHAEDTAVWWAASREEALFAGDIFSILRDKVDLFVIGGAEIYKIFSDLFNKIYLTEVFSEEIKGDAFFEQQFDRRKWKLESEFDFPATDYDQFPSRLTVFSRRIKNVRQCDISRFMVGAAEDYQLRIKTIERFQKLIASTTGNEEQHEIDFAHT